MILIEAKKASLYIYIYLFLSAWCVRSEHPLALSVHARARITPRTRWDRSINRSIDRMGAYSLARIRSRNVRGTRSPRFHSYVNGFSDIEIVYTYIKRTLVFDERNTRVKGICLTLCISNDLPLNFLASLKRFHV